MCVGGRSCCCGLFALSNQNLYELLLLRDIGVLARELRPYEGVKWGNK